MIAMSDPAKAIPLASSADLGIDRAEHHDGRTVRRHWECLLAGGVGAGCCELMPGVAAGSRGALGQAKRAWTHRMILNLCVQ